MATPPPVPKAPVEAQPEWLRAMMDVVSTLDVFVPSYAMLWFSTEIVLPKYFLDDSIPKGIGVVLVLCTGAIVLALHSLYRQKKIQNEIQNGIAAMHVWEARNIGMFGILYTAINIYRWLFA